MHDFEIWNVALQRFLKTFANNCVVNLYHSFHTYPGRKLTRISGQRVNQIEAFLFKHNVLYQCTT